MASAHTPEETRAEVSVSGVAQELQELAETLTTLGDVGNKIVNHRAHLELLAARAHATLLGSAHWNSPGFGLPPRFVAEP